MPVAIPSKVLDIRQKLLKLRPVIREVNLWAENNNLPYFFERNRFSDAYRIDAKGIGWEFSFKPFPGFPVFWLEHVESGKKACFGLKEGIENPRPRK